MKMSIKVLSILVATLLLLTACAKAPETLDIGNGNIAAPNLPSAGTTATTESSTAPDLTVDEYNLWCVRQADGKEVTGHFAIDDHYFLSIDATVDTSAVERVSKYQYVPISITDAQRGNLLNAYFGERANEVQHITSGWANQWVLKTDTEYYEFGYSRGMKLIFEETFFIRDFKALIEESDDKMLDSIDEAGMMISLDEVYGMCEILLDEVSDASYIPTNVRPFKMNSETEQGMLWIVYRQTADGMPIIADNDPKFYVSDSRVLHMITSVYNISPISVGDKILSVDEAVACLGNSASRINVENGYMYLDHLYAVEIPISKITFEYIVLPGVDMAYTITPIWRFYIGETGEDNLMLEDRIIAINALTGELISERRRHTY